MNLKAKLLICNVLLAAIVAVIGITGILYVHTGYQGELVLTGNTLTNIRLVLTKAQTDTKDVDTVVQEATLALKDLGFNTFYFDESGKLVTANSTDKIESKLASEHYKDSFETSMIIDGNVIMFVSGVNSGYLVAVNSQADGARVAKNYMIIFIVAVSLAGVVMALAVSLAEKVMIFPRITALEEGMHQVYLGNYEQLLKVEKRKSPDELSQLLAEFEMMRCKIAESEKQKEAFDRERGTMISGISHDLRTPLAIIQGHAKGLKDGVARRINKEAEYVDKIYETAVSMNALIAQLSAFAKMQSREVMYFFVEHDICDFIREYVNINYVQYSARGLNLKAIVPSGVRLVVSLDKEQFKRVLQNVCENSLKYKDKNTANLTIKVVDEGTNVVILLSDDGPGINDFEAEYIFESYYRGDTSRTNPVSGSGLGLSVVKSVVSAHHGEVTAYNDNGLTIKITIPIRRRR